MSDLSSSKIVTIALGKELEGIPSTKDGLCAFCGLTISKGDPCAPFKPSPGFMDDFTLAAKGSDLVCQYCTPLITAVGLRESGHGLFSLKEGSIPFRKWADIAKGLENPPEPPFVAVRATANNQHMAWRAPISLSRELFYVRVGLRNLRIRRPVLLNAREAAVRIGEFMEIPSTKSSIPHPYIALCPDLKEVAHGKMRWKRESGPTQEEARKALPDEFAILDNLSLGESWAMRFLLSPNAG